MSHQNFDEKAVVTITDVRQWTHTKRWKIVDSLDRQYVTRNSVVASLADRYRLQSRACRPISWPGWYRELIGLEPVEGSASGAA